MFRVLSCFVLRTILQLLSTLWRYALRSLALLLNFFLFLLLTCCCFIYRRTHARTHIIKYHPKKKPCSFRSLLLLFCLCSSIFRKGEKKEKQLEHFEGKDILYVLYLYSKKPAERARWVSRSVGHRTPETGIHKWCTVSYSHAGKKKTCSIVVVVVQLQ
jgi:hypothetical protein